jgi:ribosome-dependent ATPase
MTAAAPPVARIEGLSHRYGKVLAIDRLDLEIPAACLAGLIGPDGVGKSTLLGLIAGARKIQHGAVNVLGGDMRSSRFRREVASRIAYMPQGLGRNLYAPLSVFDNVDFFGRLFGQPAAERHRRIDELLAGTGLAPFRDRLAGQLSGGMKQKLGLCCALLHDPDVLILDEPTTGIDPLSRRQFWQLLARIRTQRPSMSVLVSTAYIEEAESFDWLAAMDAGRLLFSGAPRALMAHAGTPDLDSAFIALLPEERRRGHRALTIPPRRAEDGEPAIEATRLTRRFGDFTAVDQVSFSIGRGEIFGFLGSNGCGKTTTMKMLTGLLPATEGEVRLFGRPVNPRDLEARRRVGYMSQGFSLYGELTVRQNLDLHARLFQLPPDRVGEHVAALLGRFELQEHADALAEALPVGIRQRLSLAVAMVHEPEVLILDEPTSGVDPVARDRFWELLIDLSRARGVTIFVSTHFMNEGERCDRVALMHAGRVLAMDTPAALMHARDVATLEDAFVSYLEESGAGAVRESSTITVRSASRRTARRFSLARLLAYARREGIELRRDPIRLTFALLGSALMMVVLGYGMTLDVDNLAFAALDRDDSAESRDYIENIAGSRYFVRRAPIRAPAEIEARMQTGELALAIEIPPGFGRDVKRGRAPEIGVWVDGAMPFRGETIRGYVQGVHQDYLARLALDGTAPRSAWANLEMRYRYNQDFRSLDAMVPGTIALMLLFVPAILTALAVVREKELGSITNFYVTPVTRVEFLLGKQLPYVAIAMVSFFILLTLAVFAFGVSLKGSLPALIAGAFLYVVSATGYGLLISAFTRTQIAALFGTAIASLTPATQFCGLTDPVSSLEGAGRVIGQVFPMTYFLTITRGTFNKALGFRDLGVEFLALAAVIPVGFSISLLLLRKQAR